MKTTRIDIIPRRVKADGTTVGACLTWWDWGAGYYAVLEGQFEDGRGLHETPYHRSLPGLYWLLIGTRDSWCMRRSKLSWLDDCTIEILSYSGSTLLVPATALAPVLARIKVVRGG